MAGDAGAVADYLAAHYAWAAKALAAGSLAACTVLVAHLLLGAAEEADGRRAAGAGAGVGAAGPSPAKAGGKGRKGRGSSGSAGADADAAAAGSFPSAAARRLIEAARGADGFGALQVDVQELLAVAEAAVARQEAAGGAE
jgi:hypothetical protein